MLCKVLRLGSCATQVEIPTGSTVQEALDKAGVPYGGHSLSVNGLGAGPSTALGEGDVVVATPKIEGGGL